MVHRGAEGQVLFRSYAWERLFRIQEPLVKVLMLEFFCTLQYREANLGLDTIDTLVFRLGGVGHSMSMRQFISALGLHTAEEMESPGFTDY